MDNLEKIYEIHHFMAVSCLLSMSPCVRCYALTYSLLTAPVRQLCVAQLKYLLLLLQILTHLKKKKKKKRCFLFFFTLNIIWSGVFSKERRLLNISPVLLSRLSVKAVPRSAKALP